MVLKHVGGITKWTEENYNLSGPANNAFAVFCCCQVKVSKLLGNHKRFKWWWFSATQNFVYYFTPSLSAFCDNLLKTVNIIANFMLKWISRVHAICIIKKSLQCSIQFLNSKDFLSIFCKENILFLDDSVCHYIMILSYFVCIHHRTVLSITQGCSVMFCSTPTYIPILSLTLNTHRTSPKILELLVTVHQSKKIVEICSFNMLLNIVIIFWVIDFTIRPWHYT